MAVEAEHLVRVAISDQDRAIDGQDHVVRLGDVLVAPVTGQLSIAIEHENGMVTAAMRDMHAILSVNHHVGDEPEGLAARKTGPIATDGVAAVAEKNGELFGAHAAAQRVTVTTASESLFNGAQTREIFGRGGSSEFSAFFTELSGLFRHH